MYNNRTYASSIATLNKTANLPLNVMTSMKHPTFYWQLKILCSELIVLFFIKTNKHLAFTHYIPRYKSLLNP